MPEPFENIFHLLRFAFQGWCLQYLFRAFITPRWKGLPLSGCAVGVFWAVTQTAAAIALPLSLPSYAKLLLYTALLLAFSLVWYRGGLLVKLFPVVQFTAIHELCTWAGISLMWSGSAVCRLLADAAVAGRLSLATLQAVMPVVSAVFVVLSGLVPEVMTLLFIRRIVSCCCQAQRFERDIVYYLLPAAAGLLTALFTRTVMFTMEQGMVVGTLYETYPSIYLLIPLIALTLLAANVFSFETYRKMAGAERERAERAVLENQIAGLQSSLAETERRHEEIRAVKHDMNNHMMVLKHLLREDGGAGEQVRQYVEGLSAAVDRLDSRVRTGNMIGDAVIGGKFRYAEHEIPGIRLDADGFLLPGDLPVKDWDIGIVLSNALDNAIEACQRLRQCDPEADAYITVRSFMKKQMLFIEIENSFDGIVEIDRETGYPRSSKDGRDAHGIGLKNIRACAGKYGGDVDHIVQDKTFTLSVMLKAA